MRRVSVRKLLQIAVIAMLVIGITSCDNFLGLGEEDGSITITFSDGASSAEEGNYLSAVVLPEGEPFPDQNSEVLGAVFQLQIQDGAASDTLKEWDSENNQPTTETMVFSAGDSVDFYAWTKDSGGSPEPEPPYFEASFTIDGDRTFEVSAQDFQ